MWYDHGYPDGVAPGVIVDQSEALADTTELHLGLFGSPYQDLKPEALDQQAATMHLTTRRPSTNKRKFAVVSQAT